MTENGKYSLGNQLSFGFPINLRAVLTHLKQDMRDDWFYDCLQYNDLFADQTGTEEILLGILHQGNGRYEAQDRMLRDIPKKGLGIRYTLETDFYDRFMYQAICSFLMPFFDPLLSHRVLSHRYNKHRKKEKYLFKNRMDKWFTFEGVTFTFYRRKQTLLVTDISNFFENISIQQVKHSFEHLLPDVEAEGREKLQIRNAIQSLCKLLESWGYSDRHGLPQNRDGSSFLANIILNDVDRKMVSGGHDYFRYVDDIRIVCKTPSEAKQALQKLIIELRTVGMNINSAKTAILTVHSSPNDIADHFPSQDGRTKTIDHMWRSRSRRVISRSARYIFELVTQCIETGDTQTRQFRFAVNRLATLVDQNLFDIHSEIAVALRALLVNSLADHPASSDQYCRIFQAIGIDGPTYNEISAFLLDRDRAIHEWQNYNFWLLLATKELSSTDLVAFANDKLAVLSAGYDSEVGLSAELSAMLIWLRCTGNEDSIKPLVNIFDPSWPYQLQRYFLLASGEFSIEQLKPMFGKVGPKLRGTYKRAHRHFPENGLPFALRKTPDLLDLYDEVSAYD